jgi:outer membrane receptor protein involved in Fe transport
VFRDEEAYLDLFASYDISDHATLTFEALNVTVTDVYEYADIKDRFPYFEATGPRFFAGVTFRF